MTPTLPPNIACAPTWTRTVRIAIVLVASTPFGMHASKVRSAVQASSMALCRTRSASVARRSWCHRVWSRAPCMCAWHPPSPTIRCRHLRKTWWITKPWPSWSNGYPRLRNRRLILCHRRGFMRTSVMWGSQVTPLMRARLAPSSCRVVAMTSSTTRMPSTMPISHSMAMVRSWRECSLSRPPIPTRRRAS